MTEPASPVVAYLDPSKLFKSVPLEYPLTFDGREFREIRLVRLTTKQVADFQESIKGLPVDATVVWPFYRDGAGQPLPEGLLDALIDDDRLEIDKASRDFLPRRFRGAPDGVSTPSNGADTALTSSV